MAMLNKAFVKTNVERSNGTDALITIIYGVNQFQFVITGTQASVLLAALGL
jgi:hypothetical protein